MLTKILLAFRDEELKLAYQRNKYKYYAKSVLLITLVIFVISLALEIVNLVMEE